MTPEPPRVRILSWVERLRSWQLSAATVRGRAVAAGAAVIVLIAAIVAAVRLGVDVRSIQWGFVALAVLVSLLSPLLSAAEYMTSLRLISRTSDWSSAIYVSVIGGLANTLPLPGGLIIRLRAMTEQGAALRSALGASSVAGLIWLAISVLALSAALPQMRLVLALIAVGLAGVVVILSVSGQLPVKPLLAMVGIESLFVLSAALRFYFALRALNFEITPVSSLALAAAGPVSSALGLVPGALGIFEALSAGLAVLVGLPAGAGLLASVMLRVLTACSLLAWLPLSRPMKSAERHR